MKKKLNEFINLNFIDPSFKHGENFKIGRFNIIEKDVIVGDDVTIGDHCKIMKDTRICSGTLLKDYIRLGPKTWIGKNCVIDSYVKSSGMNTIGNNVTLRYDSIIAREVIVEDDCFISPQVMTIYKSHKGEKIGGTIVGKGSFIGTNATLNHGVQIVEGCVVGSKALVSKNLTVKGIYVGIPAKLFRVLD